ncbi:hypothetical protein [Frigoribacterium faeni]|uniref:hypothetical protein n=1 Tax=Frigoribacterium faeni TaxID=145483 RepID=UPI0031D610AD
MTHRSRLRAAIAAAVAAVTLLGGLALPAGSAAAAGATARSFTTPLAFSNPSGGFISYKAGPSTGFWKQRSFSATTHTTYAAAAAGADSVVLPDAGGGAAQVRLAGGDCLMPFGGSGGGATLSASPKYCLVAANTWSVTTEGRVVFSLLSKAMGPTQAADKGQWPYTGLRPLLLPGGGYPLADPRFRAEPLVVRVDRVNDIARTAVLGGTATKGAEIRAQGRQTTASAATGAWSLTVTGLAVGTNRIPVTQRVGGVDQDTVTAVVTVTDGGTVVPAPSARVDLVRGGRSDVPFIVQNRATRTSMTGVVELTAPEGSTFTPEQTTVAAETNRTGEGATWTPDTRLDLTNGRPGDDGRSLRFDLASNGGTLAADEYYRYTLSVDTPASAAPVASEMSYVYRGDSSAGDYRAVGSTPTRVVGAATIDTTVGGAVPGGTTDWGRSDVRAPEVRGPLTLTAPTGSRLADVEARRTTDDARQTNYRIDYSADRRTATIDGPADLTDAFWGADHQYAAFRLTLDDDVRPGDVLDGGAALVRSASGAASAEGSFDVRVDDSAPSLTAEVVLDDDVTRPATISGVGDADGTVTVREGDTVLGRTAVVAGTWSITLPSSIGHGDHTFVVEQTVGDRPFGRAEARVDLGSAVDVIEPENGKIVPGLTTVRGTGAARAEITVTADDDVATATVADDGRWEARVEIRPGHTVVPVTASQHARGDLVTTDAAQVVPDGPQELRGVVVTEPSSHFYTPLADTTVQGTATPYATVEIRAQWGAVLATAVADVNGDWAFDRAFGPSARYALTATQSLVDGRGSTSPVFELFADGSFVPLVVTSHSDGGTYVPGTVTFAGRATQGAYIEARNQYDRVLFSTRASQVAGAWTAETMLGPVAAYEITITQKAPDGTTGRITLELVPELDFVDLAVTSHVDGQTYRPGSVAFTGTGTPTAAVVATNQWSQPIGEATVDAQGEWSFSRELGPSADYDVTFTQTFRDRSDVVTLELRAPVWRPLALTSPVEGDRYAPGEPSEFVGTATPYSTVTATTAAGNVLFSVETDVDGVWRNTRAYGPDNVYRIDIAQQARDGRTDSLDTFVWAPDLPWAPLTVTSHVDGETYRPRELELRGTGAPGAVVEITNQWGTVMGRPVVDADGAWSLRRVFGPDADYALRLVMTRDDQTDEIGRFELRAPVWTEIELVAPAPGEGYGDGEAFTMTGRATPFAIVRATTSLGGQLFETAADRDGIWSNTRFHGPSYAYLIDLTQESAAGVTGDHPRFRFAPADFPAER